MDRRINAMPRGESVVIQRPPISRTANNRESFPGRLIVPTISTQLDVPSVNVIPPPLAHSSSGTRAYDRNNRSSVYTNYYVPSHRARHFSVSSGATHYTQRTQSTLHVIPTRTHSTSRHHQRGQASVSSSTGGLAGTQSSTPNHFFKRGLRRGSNAGGDKHDSIDSDAYQELESQVTEPGSGFQYAATPAVTNPLNIDSTAHQDVPVPTLVPAVRSRAGLSCSPVPDSGEKRCISIGFVGSVKLFEEFAKKLKALFRGGRKVGKWKTSSKIQGTRDQTARVEMGECYHFTNRGDGNGRRTPKSASGHKQHIRGFSWDQGEVILRIKNNETGSCVFRVTSTPGNPNELIETPLPLSYLKSHLFIHSEKLVQSLQEWNRHFQNPPPHWVINFVPNAYLRRGWHLAEEVAEYMRTFGLNTGSTQRDQWKVEYEAIGHKACLVAEHGNFQNNEQGQSGTNSTMKAAWDQGGRERHPSRSWERKEGWDGCRGLVVGIAL